MDVADHGCGAARTDPWSSRSTRAPQRRSGRQASPWAATSTSSHRRVTGPRSRSSLHAAAVLTDSGGVQREAAWLTTPCLVLRDRTEWVEAVALSGGRMVIVGLDRGKAADALARLAPAGETAGRAAVRAATLVLAPAGAAEAITTTLAQEGAA